MSVQSVNILLDVVTVEGKFDVIPQAAQSGASCSCPAYKAATTLVAGRLYAMGVSAGKYLAQRW